MLLFAAEQRRTQAERVRFCRHFSRKKCSPTWTSGVQDAQSRFSFSSIQIVARVQLVLRHRAPGRASSGLTSRVIVANNTLTDIPHIRTPMMLSSGPSMRQFDGRTTSP